VGAGMTPERTNIRLRAFLVAAILLATVGCD
jgi:hypothetical protein